MTTGDHFQGKTCTNFQKICSFKVRSVPKPSSKPLVATFAETCAFNSRKYEVVKAWTFQNQHKKTNFLVARLRFCFTIIVSKMLIFFFEFCLSLKEPLVTTLTQTPVFTARDDVGEKRTDFSKSIKKKNPTLSHSVALL